MHSHEYVTCILNKDNISLIKMMLAKGKNGKSECLLLLSLHETVQLSGAVAEDCWVFHEGGCSGPWRAPPPLPALCRVTPRSSRGHPPPPPGPGRLRHPAAAPGGFTPLRGCARTPRLRFGCGGGDTPVPAVTVCRPSRGPGFPSTGRGTRQELSSAQHPQERQGRLCPPQKCQGQGGCWL